MKTHEDYLAILREHGMTHAMLVQPSSYQTDNSAMLDAIAHARAGIIGARFNIIDLDPDEFAKPKTTRMPMRRHSLRLRRSSYVRQGV